MNYGEIRSTFKELNNRNPEERFRLICRCCGRLVDVNKDTLVMYKMGDKRLTARCGDCMKEAREEVKGIFDEPSDSDSEE